MNRVQASVKDMQDFVASIYANGSKPCEHFGMSWEQLSALENDMPEITTKKSDGKCKKACA